MTMTGETGQVLRAVPTCGYQERAAQHRAGALRGLAAIAEAKRKERERRRRGAETGWHVSGDWRLDAFQASRAASLLERHGWRAEARPLAQGIATVEVRDLAVRGHPLLAVLRRPGEAEAWLAARGHGLRGRVPSPPEGAAR
jgi:hypothetical protein